jgi:hypothetical protein
MFAGLVFFTLAFFNALRGITGTSSFAWLAPSAALAQIGDVIFRVTPRYSVSPVAAAVAIIVLVAVSLWILKRRIRGVEIVT